VLFKNYWELQSNNAESCKLKFPIIAVNTITNFSKTSKILFITANWYTIQLAGGTFFA